VVDHLEEYLLTIRKFRNFLWNLSWNSTKDVQAHFYFAHLKKENQIPLSLLISDEHGIFHKEGNLGKPIVPLDSS